MTDVEISIKSLKISWTRILLTINLRWIGIFSEINDCHTDKLCLLDLNTADKGQKPLVITFGMKLYYICMIMIAKDKDW